MMLVIAFVNNDRLKTRRPSADSGTAASASSSSSEGVPVVGDETSAGGESGDVSALLEKNRMLSKEKEVLLLW